MINKELQNEFYPIDNIEKAIMEFNHIAKINYTTSIEQDKTDVTVVSVQYDETLVLDEFMNYVLYLSQMSKEE